jgi:hypothetical protein
LRAGDLEEADKMPAVPGWRAVSPHEFHPDPDFPEHHLKSAMPSRSVLTMIADAREFQADRFYSEISGR